MSASLVISEFVYRSGVPPEYFTFTIGADATTGSGGAAGGGSSASGTMVNAGPPSFPPVVPSVVN